MLILEIFQHITKVPSADKVDFSLESVLTSNGKSQTLVKSHGKLLRNKIVFFS